MNSCLPTSRSGALTSQSEAGGEPAEGRTTMRQLAGAILLFGAVTGVVTGGALTARQGGREGSSDTSRPSR